MKTDRITMWMLAVTTVFATIAILGMVWSFSDSSELTVIWSDDLSKTVEWADNAESLKASLEALFPDRQRDETGTHNQILPNFQAVVNINTATITELTQLPGIGTILAERIIAYREENGPFEKKEDVQFVSGIGEKKYEAIKDRIEV